MTNQWATENRMPDLSHLDSKNTQNELLNSLFGGAPRHHPTRGLTTSLVRVMDKTIIEYEAARAALTEWIETPNHVMSPLLRAIDHLETCIDSLDRVAQFVEELRAAVNGPAIDGNKVPSRNQQKRIHALRGAIAHADRDLAKNRTGEPTGLPMTLMPTNDGVEVASSQVSWDDLAGWIEKYHDLAGELIR
jgi:hypothetical protein